MKLLYKLLFLVNAVLATNISECSKGPLPLAVRISGCDVPPCNFIRGTDETLAIDFGVDVDVMKLKTKVMAYTMGMSTEYPLPHSDACEDLINGECPLDKGEEVTYLLKMPIMQEFPQVSVIIEFSVITEKAEILFCFRVSGQVVDA